MNIGLNGSALRAPLTGVGQYVHHLAQGLLATSSLHTFLFNGTTWDTTLPTASTAFGTQVATGPASVTPASMMQRARQWVPQPLVSRLRRQVHQRRFSHSARPLHLALYHEPNFLAFDFDGKVVLTVHDLSWIRYESAHPMDRVRDMNRWFPKSLARADAVIVGSQFVKQELHAVFGTPEHRVQVVSNGVEPLFSPREPEQLQVGLSRFGLQPQGYWLSVGTIEPRKNLQTVLDAFMLLPLALRQRMPLVMVGPKGWGSSALQARIDALAKTGQVRWLGFLSREELALITAGACALVYPSLYEGFGLPPLEAMASGVPVVVSNISSLPEVVGSAGILVDPMDAAHIARSLEQLATESTFRDQRSEAGLQQSRQFSWSRCVKETVDVYTTTLRG